MSGRFQVLVLTTCARRAHAQRTVESLRSVHLQAPVRVVVVDDRFGEASRGQAEWTTLTANGFDAQSVGRLALAHAPEAMLRVARPSVVGHLQSGAATDVVVVVPDDAEVIGPLDELVDGAISTGLSVVAVRRTSLPRDGRNPDQREHVRLGAIDQDLFAVRCDATAFVDWWVRQVSDSANEDVLRFDPAEHPWLDDATRVFQATVVAPTWCRSYRNLDEPSTTHRPAVIRFPGFRPNRPWALSDFGGDWPRILLSEHSHVADVAMARASRFAPDDTILEEPYSRFSNGHAVRPGVRSEYRRALIAALRHATAVPPNPFAGSTMSEFEQWLGEPVDGPLSRHLVALSSDRPDLRATFAGDPGAFLEWARNNARVDGIWVVASSPTRPVHQTVPTTDTTTDSGVSVARTDVLRNDVQQRTGPDTGVNVVGMLSAQLGIGENGRLAVRTLAEARVPFALIDHDDTVNERDQTLLDGLGRVSSFRYDVDLVLLNADQTVRALRRHGREGRATRPTIGVWAWEVPGFPERMHGAFDAVDEVWGISEFVRAALADVGASRGVSVERLPVRLPEVRQRPSRSETSPRVDSLGIDPERPMFLFSFDYFSVAERKQPWAVVEAFRRAFPIPSANGPLLVIKSINREYFPTDAEHLLWSTAKRSDVVLINSYIPAASRDALAAHATAYVSLHRSEGLGLTLAESMALGTPCIATNWSGNLEFMTATNSYLVDAEQVTIAPETPVYAGCGTWAEPDVDQAASFMRQILDDPTDAAERAARAQGDIARRNSGGADVMFVVDRLRSLRHRHATRHGRL